MKNKKLSKGYLYYFLAIAVNVIYGTFGFAFNLAFCINIGILETTKPIDPHIAEGILGLVGVALLAAVINFVMYFLFRKKVSDTYKLRCFLIIFAVAPYVALIMMIA